MLVEDWVVQSVVLKVVAMADLLVVKWVRWAQIYLVLHTYNTHAMMVDIDP